MGVTASGPANYETRAESRLVALGLLAVVIVISAYLARALYVYRFRDGRMA